MHKETDTLLNPHHPYHLDQGNLDKLRHIINVIINLIEIPISQVTCHKSRDIILSIKNVAPILNTENSEAFKSSGAM